MARMTHFEKDQVIARLNDELVALRAEISQLRGDLERARSASASRPRGQLAAKFDARRAAARRYFEANPGANSVTAQDLVAFMEKTA